MPVASFAVFARSSLGKEIRRLRARDRGFLMEHFTDIVVDESLTFCLKHQRILFRRFQSTTLDVDLCSVLFLGARLPLIAPDHGVISVPRCAWWPLEPGEIRRRRRTAQPLAGS